MKTLKKVIAIYIVIAVLAVFQACWKRCDRSIYYSQIKEFSVHQSWEKNDTIKYESVNFYLECQNFTYYICRSNIDLIKKAYAIAPHFYLTDTIASIEIYSDADYDSLHPAGTLLNDIFNARLYYYSSYLNIHSDIQDTLSQINFPVRAHYTLSFNLLKGFPPSTTNLHHLTIIYTETDSTVLTYNLEPLYITQ